VIPALSCTVSSDVTSKSYPHRDLTRNVIGAFYEVYNALGSGFREIVYKRALTIALTNRGMEAECEVATTVFFREHPVGNFRADIVVNRMILLELKALPQLELSHTAQLINALRASGLEIGLLLNFGPRPQIKRMIVSHS
jgi:GxxExxY protein